MSRYNAGLKTRLKEGLSEPELYGDLVYKFRKIVGKTDFSVQFKKIVTYCKKIDTVFRGKLHAWLLTQLWLIILFPFLIARLRIGPQTK